MRQMVPQMTHRKRNVQNELNIDPYPTCSAQPGPASRRPHAACLRTTRPFAGMPLSAIASSAASNLCPGFYARIGNTAPIGRLFIILLGLQFFEFLFDVVIVFETSELFVQGRLAPIVHKVAIGLHTVDAFLETVKPRDGVG